MSLKKRLHLFPILVLAIFLVFVALRISGTSIGIYHGYLYGPTTKDSSLLFGNPQSIRSDEWLVATQLTIAQASNNYAEENDNYAEEKNLGIITDAPYSEWSTLFKPQNLTFFFLPVEFAFAFKWWFLLVILIISSYYFVLKLSNRKIIVSILSSIIISFAPFVFWWFQTGTIGPLAYGFTIMLLSMSIIDNTKLTLFGKKVRPLYASLGKFIALAYVLVAFALILYPPFQIPVAIVVALFILGYLLNNKKGWKLKDWRRIILTFVGALAVAGTICGAFVVTRSDEISTITNTAYPGKREVSSGGYNLQTLLVTYLQPQLQRSDRGAHYIQNQSESSNFIVLPLFFIVPAIAVTIWLFIKRRRIDWILVCLLVAVGIFVAHLFIPLPMIVTKLFLLHLVPQTRLLIGFGLLGFILAVYTAFVFVKEIKQSKYSVGLALLYSALFTLIVILAGFEITELYPSFVSSKLLVTLLALIPSAGFFLLLTGKLRLGLTILALLTLGSVAFIHPLYVGLGPIYKSALSQKIVTLSKPDDTWAAAEDIYLENIPQMSDRKAITGVNPYPSLDFWDDFTNDKAIYNRYAHIFLTTSKEAPLILVQPDLFAVSSACTQKINQEIDYIISPIKLDGSCNQLIDTVPYPARTFYFYKVTH